MEIETPIKITGFNFEHTEKQIHVNYMLINLDEREALRSTFCIESPNTEIIKGLIQIEKLNREKEYLTISDLKLALKKE